ncbi:DUF4783 domain-containing protein [Carboxylicivirga linearis]|uniref:DUF4783 domain-containing protein n=1 Tax=Carboxylicivirga linearis TaxID=1628157 RepID=A0ABS5K0C1_9BACT|nr:DUF4783 domain-containing protein [Carboxylicivirga linearis]MBS2100605.1 DUF4783 domain-containing protein [Carboxylicivirga linearis]
MKFLTYLVLIITAMAMSIPTNAQNDNAISTSVINAIKKGDSEALSQNFYGNIEIVLPSKTGVYSKKQAEMVLKDFFNQYPVDSFKIIHKGKKENASFAIGNYDSSKSHFRFTFLTKMQNSKLLIHQLRIEKQDE